MAITHRVRTDGVLFTEGSGVVTEMDFMSHLRSHVEDPELHAGMDEVLDLRGVTKVELSSDALRRIIAFEKHHLGPFRSARIAIVAPEDVQYGIGRMYQTLTEDTGTAVEVFRALRMAEDWLSQASTPAE